MNLTDTQHPIPSPRSNDDDHFSAHNEFDKHQKYPLEMLRGDAINLPTYINPSQKEVIVHDELTFNRLKFFSLYRLQIHLTHDDFVSVFSMSFSQFAELPKWKQVELKKYHKLF